jgi:phage shock protein A
VQFLLLLKGRQTSDIRVQWKRLETQQPLQEAQQEKTTVEAKILKRDAGVSQRQVLRELGYTEEQIEAMEAEQELTAQDAGQALLTAMNRGQ